MPASDIRPGDLVAYLAPQGPELTRAAAEVWDREAALFVVDRRAPSAEGAALLRAARPTVLWDSDGPCRAADGVPTEPGLLVATSGTSGRAKLVELGRPAVEAAVRGSLERLGAAGDRWVCCLPTAHIGGLLVVMRALLSGSPLEVHSTFEPGRLEAGWVSVVPTMLRRLLDASVDLGRLRGLLVGGGALDPGLRSRAEGAGARVVETYGMTETCGGVVYDGLPLPRAGMRVGAGGEVELGGPTLMRGYRDDPGATAEVLRDGWVRTGDAGRITPGGRLEVLGRLDDCIRTGGEKVWPSEVEAALREHPGVADAAVTGLPDAEWGERVVALVRPSDPARTPDLESIRAHVGERLARYKAPREVVLVDCVPRTASGKVRRDALRALAEGAGGRE